MYRSVVKSEDFRARHPEKDGGVGHNQKLRTLCRAPVYFHQQGQLSLWGECRLRLVQQIKPAAGEVFPGEQKEAFAVRAFVQVQRHAAGPAAVLFFPRRDVVKALRAQKISVPRPPGAARPFAEAGAFC